MNNKKIIYLAGFVFSLAVALMSYINSSFLATFIDEKSVGIIYALGSIVSVFTLFTIPTIFRKLGSRAFLLLVIGLDALSILLFALGQDPLIIALIFVAGFTLNTLIFFSLDELLKISSSTGGMGRTRGGYLALSNIAWILSQLALGTILGEQSFRYIYIVSFSIMIVLFLLIFVRLRHIPDPVYDKMNIREYTGAFFRNKNLFRAYSMNVLLQFFYCWMIIYTPIYLSLHMGFSWKEIGIIFAIMLLPFSIIPFPLGTYADKIGERKILMYGFTIISLATLSLFFIEDKSLWLWAFMLFMTRVGAASIEIGIDAYFFKHIKPENEEFISIYRTATPTAYIKGPLVALFVLPFIPSFEYLYVVLGAVMLYGIYLSSTIRKDDI
jgi:MFS family permease